MAKRTILTRPRHPLAQAVWLSSGPGRAWKWEQRAKTIPKGHCNYDNAREILTRVKAIRDAYKKGNTDWANLEVERLDQYWGVLLANERFHKAQNQATTNRTNARKPRPKRSKKSVILADWKQLRTDRPNLSKSAITAAIAKRHSRTPTRVRQIVKDEN
jgi:hypothetical protein